MIATDSNGCTGQDSYVVTSVDEVTPSFEFNISPNPAHHQVVCSWSNVNVSVIEVYDALGEKSIASKTNFIDSVV